MTSYSISTVKTYTPQTTMMTRKEDVAALVEKQLSDSNTKAIMIVKIEG